LPPPREHGGLPNKPTSIEPSPRFAPDLKSPGAGARWM
jgi:hypothetical protein